MHTLDRPTLTPEVASEVAEEIKQLADAAREEHREIEVAQILELVGAQQRPTESQWMRSTEAAERLGVSRNTVKKWARTGYLRGSRQDPDGWWRIPRISVEHVARVEAALDEAPETEGPLPWRP